MVRKLSITFITGLAFGYFGGWIIYWNELHEGASYGKWKYEWLSYPAIPGQLASGMFRSYDYRLTEAWLLDKHRSAILNAAIWTILLCPFVILGRVNKSKQLSRPVE